MERAFQEGTASAGAHRTDTAGGEREAVLAWSAIPKRATDLLEAAMPFAESDVTGPEDRVMDMRREHGWFLETSTGIKRH